MLWQYYTVDIVNFNSWLSSIQLNVIKFNIAARTWNINFKLLGSNEFSVELMYTTQEL